MTHVALAAEASTVPDERFLIARAQQGDRVAARSLYDAHSRRVHRVVFRLCGGDEEMARDFTQDTFIRVFDKLSSFRGESAFATWVHRIAVTVTLNGLRKEKRLKRGADDLDVANDLPAPSINVDPDLRAKLRAAIEALPPGSRASVILHDIEGYTHAEIGEMLGIAEGTSKARLFDARSRLKKALAAYAKY
ncbi:MAG TPA: sigma-70 family RNA polymerase sigma factor [Gemmatimonadaceae bacterium]|nr:sigma-70 family RNA polymerase sigma factor [Gemmatimonadaceae bacterium]